MRVSDIVKFILENRKGKVCEGWSPYQITYDIAKALEQNTLAYTVNGEGKLTGICWGCPNFETKTLYIENILTIDRTALPLLVKHFKNVYKGWSMTAHRHKVFRQYNTDKLISKIYGLKKT